MAVSATSGLLQVTLGSLLGQFADKNALPWQVRNVHVVVLSVVFGASAIGGGVLALKRPIVADRAFRRCAPGLLACFVPLLFSTEPWHARELTYLVFLGFFGLSLEGLFRVAARAGADPTGENTNDGTKEPGATLESTEAASPGTRRRFAICLGLVFAAAAIYVALVAPLAIRTHRLLLTSSSDLAEFDNLFFNALHGHPFRSPAIDGALGNWTALKIHAEFLLYLLLPFYALHPSPESLLVIQTLIIAAAAIPVFLFAKDRVGPTLAVALALAYLLCPAVERPNFYDFHFTPLGMLVVSWALYFLSRLDRATRDGDAPAARRALRFFCAFAVLSVLSREDIALGFGIACAVLAVSNVLPRVTLTTALAACAYFVVIKFGIMSRLGVSWFDTLYADLKAEDEPGFVPIFSTLVSNPGFTIRTLLTEPKLLYLLHMSVPVLFLWWRRPWLLLAAVPGFLFTILVTNRPPMFESSFQYTFHWIPYVFAASAMGLQSLGAGTQAPGARRWPAATALLVVAVSASYQLGVLGGDQIVGGFGRKFFRMNDAQQKRIANLEKIAALIPPSASVAATEAEGPHVSTRLVMYSLKYTVGDSPDYILIGGVGIRSEGDHLRQVLADRQYGFFARLGEFVLLKRGADPKANQNLLHTIPGLGP